MTMPTQKPKSSPPGRAEDARPFEPPLRYRPVWNVRQKVIGLYRCDRPVSPIGGAIEAGDPEAAGRADGMVLTQVLADIGQFTAEHDIGSVCLPLHHATLTHAATRDAFVALCGAIPAALRGALVWEITDMPQDTCERSLFSIVSTIKPFARAIFVRSRLEESDFEIPAAVGVHSVGLDLGETAETETHILSLLGRFAETAHRAGLRCHVHGAATSSIALAAVSAGFDYLAGDAISGTVAAPGDIRPFDTENLFLNKQAGAG
jgi:hypothetical protein